SAADELIEELIFTCTAPRQLTVVSADHRLHQAANRRKARPVDSDIWFAEVVRESRARQQPETPSSPGKPTSVPSEEVDNWLDFLKLDEPLDSDDIFPDDFDSSR